MGYLNINSIRKKVIDLNKSVKHSELDYLLSRKQFAMKNFEIRAKKKKRTSGILIVLCEMVFFLFLRLTDQALNSIEFICSELTI